MLGSNCQFLFMDNYFTFFRLFVCSPTLVLTTYEQEVCSRKIVYANILSSEINTCKKRNVATLNSAAHDQQKCCVTCVAGQNDSRALSIASSVSCQPNRNLFDVGANLKESIFKSNNQINSTVTTRTWVLTKNGSERGQTQDRYPNKKIMVVPVCLNCRCCSSVCAGIVLTKIKAMSLYLFWLSEEMLSMKFCWNIQRKTNYPRAMQEFEISHHIFVMMPKNIVRRNLNAGKFRTPSSI